MPLTACTVVSKNYLAFARVLAASFRRWCPEGRFVVLLIDRADDYFDPAAEPFEIIEVAKLPTAPRPKEFLFKYSVLEANTAFKPFFLEYLLEQGADPVIYFDPDIEITGPLDLLLERLTGANIVLTPHLTSPIDDDLFPGELAILQSGAYNLGFVAVRNTPVSRTMVAWWQDRLEDRCVVRIEEGLFVDQKWIDLVPGMYEGVHVLTDPGYNVAYWNLNGRQITVGPDGPQANGRPLTFFHYSGIEPESLDNVSKHQDRFRLADLGDAARLYRSYADQLFAAGFREARAWPYSYGYFDNGVAIPDYVRGLYLGLSPRRRRRFGDPFVTEGPDSLWFWLNQPRRGAAQPPFVSRHLYHLYTTRSDLAERFPDPEGADLAEFAGWVFDHGRHELGVDPEFLTCLAPDGVPVSPSSLGSRVERRLRRAYRSRIATDVRRRAKRFLGPERTAAVKRRLGRGRPRAEPPAGLAHALPLPTSIERPGVNLVGYLQAETGMGQAARSLLAAFEAAGIPVAPHSLDLNVMAPNREAAVSAAPGDFPFDLNLWVVNADQVPEVYSHAGPEAFLGRYNAGLWLWELAHFPATFHGAFDYLHEVWTPSSFCVEAISAQAPIPVKRVPLPVVPAAAELDRAHFGLPEATWIVLFMFNYLSYQERKNPLAAIEAYRRAFGDQDDTLFVLKTSQADIAPEGARDIQAALAGTTARLLDCYLTGPEVSALVANCDCYLSLHRSEGYGLTLAEAMYHGKPVVATPYSGNADFFDLNNGYPVRYELAPIGEDTGPYPAGAQWAEPEIHHAAELLRQARLDSADRERRVERAARDVRQGLSHEAVGRVLRERFDAILRRVARSQAGHLTPT